MLYRKIISMTFEKKWLFYTKMNMHDTNKTEVRHQGGNSNVPFTTLEKCIINYFLNITI